METTLKHGGYGPEHYKKHGEVEVIVAMENEAEKVFHETGSIKKALSAALAVKHELRMGTKEGNTIEMEQNKARNYRHRQEFGKWIGE